MTNEPNDPLQCPVMAHLSDRDERVSYDAPSAILARERTLVFFEQHLT